jgi:hypothetical protein
MDLLITLTIVGMVAAVIAPNLSDDRQLRLIAAADVVTSDLEFSQVLNITQPDDPVVVRFDPATATYWLARMADSETPIARDDTGAPYLVTLGVGRASAAAGVSLEIEQIDFDMLMFNGQGGVFDPTVAPAITLREGDRWIRLDIANTTGSITQTSGVESETEPEAEPEPPGLEGGKGAELIK